MNKILTDWRESLVDMGKLDIGFPGKDHRSNQPDKKLEVSHIFLSKLHRWHVHSLVHTPKDRVKERYQNFDEIKVQTIWSYKKRSYKKRCLRNDF